jgi:hypothetical protein
MGQGKKAMRAICGVFTSSGQACGLEDAAVGFGHVEGCHHGIYLVASYYYLNNVPEGQLFSHLVHAFVLPLKCSDSGFHFHADGSEGFAENSNVRCSSYMSLAGALCALSLSSDFVTSCTYSLACQDCEASDANYVVLLRLFHW